MLSDDELHGILVRWMIYLSPITFLFLVYGSAAPYGKLFTAQSRIVSGPLLPPRFSWMIFESPNLFWCAWCYRHRDPEVFGDGSSSLNANAILFALFFGHYINRDIIYPLRMSPRSKPCPLLMVLSALAFCAVNGFVQAQNLCRFQRYPPNYHLEPHFLAGLVLFFVGFFTNNQSDTILRKLRNAGEGYKIPRGGTFKYVSCANLFGEIVEWGGYALASWSLPAAAFFLYTVSNLVPRALSQHRWYRAKFEDYPRERKALIPFIL